MKSIFSSSSRSLALVLTTLLIASCATSPTGRSQLILVSDREMNAMGAASFEKMQENAREEGKQVLTSGQKFDYVRCIADAILTADERDTANWEVVVFEGDAVNAFALPGKKIGVYTGMVELTDRASQLAAVIGHEIGHVDAKHGSERVSLSMTNQVAQQAASVLLEGHGYRKGALAALGLGAQFGVVLPYSRTHETEADVIGIYLMAKAGFDPEGAVELWQKMSRRSGNAPPEFMSTHPSNQSRINALTREMQQAKAVYRDAQAKGLKPNCE